MALEIGAVYVLERAGERGVLNDPTDDDYIGLLDPDDGLTGLDGAEVRENADTLVEADGGVHGDFYRGRRPITMKGIIWPDPLLEANRRQEKMLYLTDALSDDLVVTWTETGSVEKMLELRAQQPTRITGRRPKNFFASLVSADHRIYSSVEHAASFVAAGAVGALGAVIVENAGNKDSPPHFRIDGPITNPTVRNETTGQEIVVNPEGATNLVIPDGQYLELDVIGHTAMLNGVTNTYSSVDFDLTEWFGLVKGDNDIRLKATAYTGGQGAGLQVHWRDAWTG